MGHRKVATLGIKQVQVQVSRQILKQVDAGLIEAGALGREIIGADDRRVATGSTATQVAFFQDGDIGNAVVLGQVVGSRQAVPTAADDDRVVLALEPSRRAEHPGFGVFLGESKLQ